MVVFERKFPLPSPGRMDTLFEWVTNKSRLPSWSKSAFFILLGSGVLIVLNSTDDNGRPKELEVCPPLPSRTTTSRPNVFADAKSSVPSLLKSPTVIPVGFEVELEFPLGTSYAKSVLKRPVPSPYKTRTESLVETSAVRMISRCPSPSMSAVVQTLTEWVNPVLINELKLPVPFPRYVRAFPLADED